MNSTYYDIPYLVYGISKVHYNSIENKVEYVVFTCDNLFRPFFKLLLQNFYSERFVTFGSNYSKFFNKFLTFFRKISGDSRLLPVPTKNFY